MTDGPRLSPDGADRWRVESGGEADVAFGGAHIQQGVEADPARRDGRPRRRDPVPLLSRRRATDRRDADRQATGGDRAQALARMLAIGRDRLLDDELVRGFMSRVMLEAKAIGEHIGIPIAQEPEDRHAVTRKLGAFRTSMLQDVQAGKPVELDALVSAVRSRVRQR